MYGIVDVLCPCKLSAHGGLYQCGRLSSINIYSVVWLELYYLSKFIQYPYRRMRCSHALLLLYYCCLLSPCTDGALRVQFTKARLPSAIFDCHYLDMNI